MYRSDGLIDVIIIPERHVATLMDVDAPGMADLQAMMELPGGGG